MSLRTSLPLVVSLVAILATICTGIVTYYISKSTIEEGVSQKLEALANSRHAALDQYMDSIRQDLVIQAENLSIKVMLKDFSSAWEKIEGNKEAILQSLYIDKNKHPLGEKDKLYDAKDGSVYSQLHAKNHPFMHKLQQERGYYDIFLFNPAGDLVYSVYKELDYATNLKTGKWKDSGLGFVFQKAISNGTSGYIIFDDFKAYAPSHGAPASFIATPIVENGTLLGVLAYQMPIDRLNAVMQVNGGMGESGETYIVGKDLLMRSDSRFSDETTILKVKVDSETVKLALAGQSGVSIVPDYRGIPVYSAYEPLEFQGTTWAIMAEIDQAEVDEPTQIMLMWILVLVIIVIIVSSIVGISFGRSVAVPLSLIVELMEKMATGDLNVNIPVMKRENAIGRIANTLGNFKESLLESERLTTETNRENEEKVKRAEQVQAWISDFSSSSDEALSAVNDASSSMQNTSASLITAVSETNMLSAGVATAAEQASANVNTVASAAEELSSSISEISRQVQKSSEVALQAVESANRSDELVSTLAESAGKIGEVVTLITDIAEQTNLLALNATIEAARAGDAGKGFAVVANEVKSLATQTSRATDEIGSHIGTIQSVTQDTVKAIKEISVVIGEINETATGIASAVEEQGAATQEIARNTQQAADGTKEVTTNITGVSNAASQSDVAAKQVSHSAEQLTQQADRLKNEISGFLQKISST